MAQITLRYGYRGWKSKERFIPPGTYDDHDPRVKDIVAYLVENGHATVIDVGVSQPEAVQPTVTQDTVDQDVEASPEPDVTFTDGALSLFDEFDIDADSLKSYFAELGIERVTKADADQYVESLT